MADSAWSRFRWNVQKWRTPHNLRHMRVAHPDFSLKRDRKGGHGIYWRGKAVGSTQPLEHLRAQLAARKNVGHAWIARKRVAILPESPVYVLAWKPKGWFVKATKVSQAIADEVELQGECFVVPRSGETKAMAKRVIERGEQLL